MQILRTWYSNGCGGYGDGGGGGDCGDCGVSVCAGG